MAKEDSMKKYLPKNVSVQFKYYDDECSQDKASGSVIYAVQDNKCIHIIFGPICDYSLGKFKFVSIYKDYIKCIRTNI